MLLASSCTKDDTNDPIPDPNHDPIPEFYKSLSAGSMHSMAIDANGQLWVWGSNEYGQLGDSSIVDRNWPFLLGDSFIEISAGNLAIEDYNIFFSYLAFNGFSMAIKTDGTLWSWGNNEYGQLGDGTYENRNTPMLVDSGYTFISTGNSHTLAIKADGTLWSWGRYFLGDSIFEQINVPTLVGENFKAIAAGSNHSLALKSDGTRWAWGINVDGQLGLDKQITYTHTPTLIGSGYMAIAAGYKFSIALKSDGTLWGWGTNYYGQLGIGDGQLIQIYSPVQIGSGFTAVSAGLNHTLADSWVLDL